MVKSAFMNSRVLGAAIISLLRPAARHPSPPPAQLSTPQNRPDLSARRSSPVYQWSTVSAPMY